MDELLAELVAAGLGCRGSKRLRLAVTPEEYIEVRRRLLERDGRFYGRVRNIRLVIDHDARKPRFIMEIADGETDSEDQGRQSAENRKNDGGVQGGRPEVVVGREGHQPEAGSRDQSAPDRAVKTAFGAGEIPWEQYRQPLSAHRPAD